MKVRFTEDFDWTPEEDGRVQIAFRADGGPEGDGVYGKVRRACGEAAIAAGKGVDLTFNGADPAAFDHDRNGAPGGAAKAVEGVAGGGDDEA